MSGIIILGMHRSGTSLVAEMVHHWGAFGRVDECLPSNRWNARGYWELKALVDFNNRLLGRLQLTWNFPPGPKDDSRIRALATDSQLRHEAEQLHASMNPDSRQGWFWKDPRLCLLLPFWQEIWGDVRYVICVRDPVDVCVSLRQRNGFSYAISLALWHRYTLALLEWTRERPRIFLNYSEVLRDPAAQCTRLATFLGSNSADPLSSGEALQKAVQAELCHYTQSNSPVRKRLSRSQTELYKALLHLSSDTGQRPDTDPQRYALPRTWRLSLKKDYWLQERRERYRPMVSNLTSGWRNLFLERFTRMRRTGGVD